MIAISFFSHAFCINRISTYAYSGRRRGWGALSASAGRWGPSMCCEHFYDVCVAMHVSMMCFVCILLMDVLGPSKASLTASWLWTLSRILPSFKQLCMKSQPNKRNCDWNFDKDNHINIQTLYCTIVQEHWPRFLVICRSVAWFRHSYVTNPSWGIQVSVTAGTAQASRRVHPLSLPCENPTSWKKVRTCCTVTATVLSAHQ